MLQFTVPEGFDAGEVDPELVQKKSRHYLHFVLNQRCVGCLGLSVRQVDRTTAHHIRPAGMAMKCSDFLTIPVEMRRHVAAGGNHSIDQLGKPAWLVHHNLPGYEEMARFYLALYLDGEWPGRDLSFSNSDGKRISVPPSPESRHGAAFYFNQLSEQLDP